MLRRWFRFCLCASSCLCSLKAVEDRDLTPHGYNSEVLRFSTAPGCGFKSEEQLKREEIQRKKDIEETDRLELEERQKAAEELKQKKLKEKQEEDKRNEQQNKEKLRLAKSLWRMGRRVSVGGKS